MTSMQGDIVNRVKRLPKPSLAAEALQPVFEAVSNSLHAIEDAFGDALYQTKGVITVTIRNARSPDDIEIIVDDNGIGLEPPRFRAFCTTDTDYKMERGGKGVGAECHHRDMRRAGIASQHVQCRDAADARQVDVHQDLVGFG